MFNIKFPEIKKKYKKENLKVNPDFFWKILVIFSMILIIVFFFFSYNLFSKINGDTMENSQKVDSIGDNKEQIRIKKILKYFEERQNKTQEIINSQTGIVDPSL